jgi:hypothetical protein
MTSLSAARLAVWALPMAAVVATDAEALRRAMFEDGVAVVPGVVDATLRAAALRAINAEVCAEGRGTAT